MDYTFPILLLIPLCCAVLHRRMRKYPFSPAVTLSCAVISLLSGYPLLFLGLCVSAVGDWFLNHERGRTGFFLAGVGGFFLGHLCFTLHSLIRGIFSLISLLVSSVLFGLIAWFLLRRVKNGIDGKALRYAVVLYAGISCFSLGASLCAGFSLIPGILFTSGIGMILFSDCIIALSRFGGVRGIGKWIMPTYFACHILMAAACALEKIL